MYRYLPVSEVGGDFFDLSLLKDSKYRILISDATGHGVHAAMITMAIKGLYDPIKNFELPPAKVLEIFNEEFMDNFVSLNSLLTAMILDIDLIEKNPICIRRPSCSCVGAERKNPTSFKNGKDDRTQKTNPL